MAHGLKLPRTTRLHQALHGYVDGHRQLALSTKLTPRDQKRLLELSDISGPGARPGEGGYLTGYPLTDSGLFALGRTWAAPEMPRPGCVWTHTLLIDFTDLGAIGTLTGLLNMFRRPLGSGAALEYGEAVVLAADGQTRFLVPAENWARQVMLGLYGRPRSRILATRIGDEVDATVLALWSQQWPRLRRSFRFCTLAASDRSVESNGFDLQVVPSSDRGVRTRFCDAIDAETGTAVAVPWLDDAVDDLLRPGGSALRDLFRRLGADIAVGREAFRPFCRLHRALMVAKTQSEAIHDAIGVLRKELGDHRSRIAQGTVAKAAVEHVETLDEESFRFLWDNLSFLDADTVVVNAVRLGRAAWRRDPGLLTLLRHNERRVVVDRTLAELDASELLIGLAHSPDLHETALARRPELLGHATFWAMLDNVDEAFRMARGKHARDAALALMLTRRGDLAPRAVQEFGPRLILQALTTTWDTVADGTDAWLHASTRDLVAVAEFLATEASIPRPMLYRLTRTVPPRAVPNDYGDDPWLIAARHAVGDLEDDAASYMAAYLLTRAFSNRTRSAGELAQLSLERTHAALAGNRLLYDGWRLLESQLPWSATWFEWDRCHRVRAGVVALFVDRDLDPGLFARVCEGDQLFSSLSERAVRSKRGRSFLKRVRRSLEDARDGRLAVRVSIVDRLLG